MRTADVPDLELYVLINYFLDVAPDCRLGLDHFAQIATGSRKYTVGRGWLFCQRWPAPGLGF